MSCSAALSMKKVLYHVDQMRTTTVILFYFPDIVLDI